MSKKRHFSHQKAQIVTGHWILAMMVGNIENTLRSWDLPSAHKKMYRQCLEDIYVKQIDGIDPFNYAGISTYKIAHFTI